MGRPLAGPVPARERPEFLADLIARYLEQRESGESFLRFARRLSDSQLEEVYLQPSAHFGLPEDDAAPVIMVGPGTGSLRFEPS